VLEQPRYEEWGATDGASKRSLPCPPPEVPASGRSASLIWQPPDNAERRAFPARHPLLAIASTPTRKISQPRPHGHFLIHVLEPILHSRSRAQPAPVFAEDGRRSPEGKRSQGDPLVIVAAGGRGGTGRTTLANEVASAMAGASDGSAWRVLLVDADPFQPDLELKLGASDVDSAWGSSAGIDRILQQLPELADQRVSLDSLLWVGRESGVRALFAPRHVDRVGREHLDYLYTYLVTPAFDAVVVDVGNLLDCSGTSMPQPVVFWLGLADTILIPLRPTESHARAAVTGVGVLGRMGIDVQRCRLIMGVARSEAAEAVQWQAQLSEFVVLRWPWVADVARKATSSHRTLSAIDRHFAASLASLLPDLTAARHFKR
jgi:MinD-like ATPase involved in chromosome partitioning or flagellar assembly